MYIRIRPIDYLLGEPDYILHVCKTTYISDIEEKILKKWPCAGYRLRLIYKGQNLSPHFRVIDYNIKINDVIQVSITIIDNSRNICPNLVNVDSKFYKIGDLVDVRCDTYFCWWSAVIVGVKKHECTVFTNDMSNEDIERKFSFFVRFDKENKKDQIYITTFDSLRPRSTIISSLDELKKGDIILANCSWWLGIGFWYQLYIDTIDTKTQILIGTLVLDGKVPVIPLIIDYDATKKIYKVGQHTLLADLTPIDKLIIESCEVCVGKREDRCRECGCYMCAGKNDPGAIVLCDECDKGYHYYCLDPPLPVVPTETEWYCPNCINTPNIIVVGNIPETFDKQFKTAVTLDDDNKVWGGGMACVGRTKECTIVPLHHFGPIPGVDVGIRWKFRIQASEAGVHRPPVAGIHGRDNDGAYSLVIAGGYEDDVDKGIEFIYCGSGGRDLSGNKRVGDQNRDQELTRNNKALALNCNAKFNDETGAKSDDWKKGKPVRVCRSYKLAPFSKYAPKDGIRYDGIYKVVKYYKEKGKSGFYVWKYLMRRDDPTPAPWQKDGQEYDIIYPEGYLEAKKVKLSQKGESSKKRVLTLKDFVSNEGETSKIKKSSNKTDTPILGPNDRGKGKSTKKAFKLDSKIEKLIKSDTLNAKLWEECAQNIKLGKFHYTAKVQETFKCIVCQEVVFNPVTTKCRHSTCIECLKRSFESDIFECPYCRNNLGQNYKMRINTKLSQILLLLIPGYAQYR